MHPYVVGANNGTFLELHLDKLDAYGCPYPRVSITCEVRGHPISRNDLQIQEGFASIVGRRRTFGMNDLSCCVCVSVLHRTQVMQATSAGLWRRKEEFTARGGSRKKKTKITTVSCVIAYGP